MVPLERAHREVAVDLVHDVSIVVRLLRLVLRDVRGSVHVRLLPHDARVGLDRGGAGELRESVIRVLRDLDREVSTVGAEHGDVAQSECAYVTRSGCHIDDHAEIVHEIATG